MEPTVAGDPQSLLRWTSEILRKLAEELKVKKHAVSHQMVRALSTYGRHFVEST